MLIQVCFLLYMNVLSQMEGSHTFPGWRTVQSFRGWIHPALAHLEGQLHAQDRPEEVEIGSSASKTRKLCVIGSPVLFLGVCEAEKNDSDIPKSKVKFIT